MLSAEAELGVGSRRRNGVFALDDWLRAGLSQGLLHLRIGQGAVVRLQPRTYAFTAVPPSWEQQVAAAVLSCPGLAAASHVTAAYLWDMVKLAELPREIEVVARRWRRAERDFVVHESTDLVEDHVTELRGIPVTIPARTVIDLGASARGLVGPALDNGLRAGLFTLEEVLELLQRVARRGRGGCGIIRPHLAEQVAHAELTDSYLETLFDRGLAEHALPRPKKQVTIWRPNRTPICRADFAYLDARLLVALDGMATHTERERFQLDRSQQNELELEGWMVLRYTWWDVTGRMWWVAEQIRKALERRLPSPNLR